MTSFFDSTRPRVDGQPCWLESRHPIRTPDLEPFDLETTSLRIWRETAPGTFSSLDLLVPNGTLAELWQQFLNDPEAFMALHFGLARPAPDWTKRSAGVAPQRVKSLAELAADF